MRASAVTLGLVAALALGGCSDGAGSSTSADCAAVVRYEGHEYADAGFVVQDFHPVGTAEVADCSDGGSSPVGPYFPDDPDTATVSSVDGLDADLAVAVRDTPDSPSLRVLVRLDAPAAQVDAAMAELAREQPVSRHTSASRASISGN